MGSNERNYYFDDGSLSSFESDLMSDAAADLHSHEDDNESVGSATRSNSPEDDTNIPVVDLLPHIITNIKQRTKDLMIDQLNRWWSLSALGMFGDVDDDASDLILDDLKEGVCGSVMRDDIFFVLDMDHHLLHQENQDGGSAFVWWAILASPDVQREGSNNRRTTKSKMKQDKILMKKGDEALIEMRKFLDTTTTPTSMTKKYPLTIERNAISEILLMSSGLSIDLLHKSSLSEFDDEVMKFMALARKFQRHLNQWIKKQVQEQQRQRRQEQQKQRRHQYRDSSPIRNRRGFLSRLRGQEKSSKTTSTATTVESNIPVQSIRAMSSTSQ